MPNRTWPLAWNSFHNCRRRHPIRPKAKLFEAKPTDTLKKVDKKLQV